MPRKVFISFLGTNQYRECEYVKDDFAYRSCFIQEATYLYLTSQEEWSDNDRILILLTQQAEEKNWEDNGHKDRNTGDIIRTKGLNKILHNIAGQTVIETIKAIPEGKDEQEIYSIFEKVYEYLQDEDILYFDLTHGFRYLPMLILVLGNYAKFLKNVTVKSITYGNWEMSANGTKPAPIIDLLSLSELQDWTFAAGQFIESGNAKKLVDLSKKEYIPILNDSLGANINAKNLKSFTNALDTVVTERQTCRGFDIFCGKSISYINSSFRNLSSESSTPYLPIFKKIAGTWSSFSETNDYCNGIRAANWCYEKGLYMQSATLLRESIVYICSVELGLNPLANADQISLSGAFDYAANSLDSFSKKRKDDYKEEIRRIGELLLVKWPSLVSPYQLLSQNIRNDFDHAGIRKSPWKSRVIIEKLKEVLNAVSTLFINNQPVRSPQNQEFCFVNISNHPSLSWDGSQIIEARKYGAIRDISFPDVSPNCSLSDIDIIAHQLIKSIIQEYLASSTVIHIMGEMTLTFALVTELKALGYTCLASTTERKVSYDKNGDKVVHFEFVQFREY